MSPAYLIYPITIRIGTHYVYLEVDHWKGLVTCFPSRMFRFEGGLSATGHTLNSLPEARKGGYHRARFVQHPTSPINSTVTKTQPRCLGGYYQTVGKRHTAYEDVSIIAPRP